MEKKPYVLPNLEFAYKEFGANHVGSTTSVASTEAPRLEANLK